jgi:hypothetical protein
MFKKLSQLLNIVACLDERVDRLIDGILRVV